MDLNETSRHVVDAAMKVHSVLGPGLLENAYEACLQHELVKRGIPVERQVALPVIYDGIRIDLGYRLDLLIGQGVIVEIKAVDKVTPLHEAQLLSYLKLGGKKLGLLINFNVVHIKDGVKRMANGL